MKKSVGPLVTKYDLEKVLNIMLFHNRTSGYMDFRGNELLFFDSKPEDGAAYITMQEVKYWLTTY